MGEGLGLPCCLGQVVEVEEVQEHDLSFQEALVVVVMVDLLMAQEVEEEEED